MLVADVLLRRLHESMSDSLIRAFADDTAMIVKDFDSLAPTVIKVFKDLGAISGLYLDITKTVVIPLFAEGAKTLLSDPKHDPWRGVAIASAGTYLGFALGPGSSSWTKPFAKYQERACLWRLPSVGLNLAALVYNTVVVSVLSFVWQLSDPPDDLLDVEQRILLDIAPGPYQWILPSDLIRLKQVYGMPYSFRSIRLSALSTKLRVFKSEPYDWEARARQLAYGDRNLNQRGNSLCPGSDGLTVVSHSLCTGPCERLAYTRLTYTLCGRICLSNMRSIRNCLSTLRQRTFFGRELTRDEKQYFKCKKLLQRTAYDSLIQTKQLQHPESRLKHKLTRWQLDSHVSPGKLARRLLHRIKFLHSLVPPRVVAAFLRTWFNGRCTTRRFQTLGPCLFGCGGCDTDCIEHYARCLVVTKTRTLFRLPVAFSSLLGFLGGVEESTPSEQCLNALVVYAAYQAHNTLRQKGPTGSLQAEQMLVEFHKLATQCHSFAAYTLSCVLGTGSNNYGDNNPGSIAPSRTRRPRASGRADNQPSRRRRVTRPTLF